MDDGVKGLFRAEALAEVLDNGYGPIRVAQPISSFLTTLSASIFAVLLICFVGFGELEKKSAVIGITQPKGGSLAIIAPSGGVLVKRFVAEGAVVRAGQPLFEVSTTRQNNAGEITGLIAHQLKSRKMSLESERRNRRLQDEDRHAALRDRLRNLDAEEVEISSAIELAERRRELGQKSVDQYMSLQRVHFASPAQLQEKQEVLIDLDSRISALTRSKVQLKGLRLGLENERKELARRSETELLQLDRTEASLEQESAENESRRSAMIIAPADGTVTTITYQSGQGILGGQVLATLVSGPTTSAESSSLEIHLYVPSRTAGFIATGQTVFLRYQAFAYQKFGLQRGTIIHVGDTPFAPNELPTNVAATILGNTQLNSAGQSNNEALYRITVQPDFQYVSVYGKRQALKPGMSLSADVIQEKRYLWEWIIDPIRALRGHL